MCIFNTAVKEVGGTKILVTRCGGGKRCCRGSTTLFSAFLFLFYPPGHCRQLVVYRNYVTAEFDTVRVGRSDPKDLQEAEKKLAAAEKQKGPTPAMILPFPAANPKNKVELIDLHENKTLFADLELCFPRLKEIVSETGRGRGRLASHAPRSAKLAVERVGSYNISVAYSIEDLHRIDEDVFTVAPNVDSLLAKHYGKDFGFIICAFADNAEKHPLAYIHDVAEDGKLFIPTRHHHHGDKEEASAHWDHDIYSYGTALDAGESVSEAEHRLAATKPAGMIVEKGSKNANQILQSLPGVKVDIIAGFELRVTRKKGDLPNMDVYFGVA